MARSDDNFELDALLGTEPREEEDAPLTAEQEAEALKIQALGFRRVGHFGDFLHFVRKQTEAGAGVDRSQPKEARIHVRRLQSVASNLANYRFHEEYKGVISHDGTSVEFLIQTPGRFRPSGRVIEDYAWDYQAPQCTHTFAPWVIRTGTREYKPGFHLNSPGRDACIELSEISPVAEFMCREGNRVPLDYIEYTIKVLLPAAVNFETSARVAQAAAQSLLFELDVKYDLSLTLIPRKPERGRAARKSPPVTPQTISFPSTVVPPEVAALFSFAAEAADNLPFAFLSYYQVLEYYLPLTSQRDALKRIRREIRDFSFNISSDASVLRVLNTVERAKVVSEEEALKILVRDCVREDKLEAFFQSESAQGHFVRNGPIQGVPAINLKATNETVAVQAAKRVYALRNRIVHAKDDPRYAETPQLLPRSNEADALGEDIRLARFLALETIVDTQD
ncbi:hypothetical protein [Streptomyces sp. NBC_01602]|uniref:hypothetical protein n=1 Tax=Streptomyces sp. NBC_01602 TaxID=2975893 RepID=UPI003863CE11